MTTHTTEIVRSPPKPKPVARPLESLDRIDRAILQLVMRADGALSPECISEKVNEIVDGRSTPTSIGHRLRKFSIEGRLTYVDRDGEHYAMRRVGRERGGTIPLPAASGSPSSPVPRTASRQATEGC